MRFLANWYKKHCRDDIWPKVHRLTLFSKRNATCVCFGEECTPLIFPNSAVLRFTTKVKILFESFNITFMAFKESVKAVYLPEHKRQITRKVVGIEPNKSIDL